MALKYGRMLTLLLTAAGLVAGACRSTTLCANEACVQIGGAAGDVGVVGDGGGGGEAASGKVPAEAAASGAAGQTAEAGAGGAGAPAGLTCPDGFGDCDGSKLTGCEANLEWHSRNCGTCGNRCEGGCSGGNCLEALRIGNVMPTSMVSTRTVAFALAPGQLELDLLLKIGVSDGKMQELTTVPSRSELALGSDLVYVWDPDHDESESGLMSIEFAGTRLQTEPLQRADSFGASEKGAYYIEEEVEPDVVDDLQRLWFRPRADAAWELLNGDLRSAELIASSSAGVVMRHYPSEADQAKLYLLDGRDVIDYGVEPDGFNEVVATERGITVLSSDSAQSRLVWLTAGGDSKQYVLRSHPTGQGRSLVTLRGEVALTFREPATMMLQFNDNGPVRSPIGLARTSELALVDYHFMWHHALDTSITPRLTRSTLFPIDP